MEKLLRTKEIWSKISMGYRCIAGTCTVWVFVLASVLTPYPLKGM
jgi:hypothetical protein